MWESFLKTVLSTLIPMNALSAPSPSDIPDLRIPIAPLSKSVFSQSTPLTTVKARAALVIETHSNETLYQKNVWEVFPIASLTKLMTALLVVEHLDMDTIVEVPLLATKIQGSALGLIPGERIQVKDLLRGMLIPSGNDAAFALAMAVSGTPDRFVQLMNERSRELGLEHTTFVDPAGLGEGNVSSAFELAHLAKRVFRDPFLLSVMKEEQAHIPSFEQKIVHEVKNTNKLLGTKLASRIIAGKTGTTTHAGQCLLAYLRHATSDRTTLTIVLGSPDRYQDIEQVIEWVDGNFRWN